MVGVSASVNLPLHHKVQKFSSGTGSLGWSRKKGRKTVVCVCVQVMAAATEKVSFASSAWKGTLNSNQYICQFSAHYWHSNLTCTGIHEQLSLDIIWTLCMSSINLWLMHCHIGKRSSAGWDLTAFLTQIRSYCTFMIISYYQKNWILTKVSFK